MDKEYFKEVAQSIESGEYFEDAKDWYSHKYVYPNIERSYLILFAVAALTISFFAVGLVVDFLPLKKIIPVAVKVSEEGQTYATIQNMDESGIEKNSNAIIMKYMTKSYLKKFETYDYRNNFELLKKNLAFIKQFSSDEALARYKGSVSIRNPNSNMMLYRKHTRRTVEVLEDSFFLETTPEGTYSAYFDFLAYEINARGVKTSNWKAKIDFHFTDVVYNPDEKDFESLDFKVIDYQSAEFE